MRSLLMLCVAALLHAQAATDAQPTVNTWSARSAGGLTLMGTFTVVPDTIHGTVTGTWTLNRTDGSTMAQGGWSAVKSPSVWTGAWRSVVTGSNREFSGTWSASTSRKGRAGLPELFLKQTVEQIVGGGWRSGGDSGAWSIRIGG